MICTTKTADLFLIFCHIETTTSCTTQQNSLMLKSSFSLIWHFDKNCKFYPKQQATQNRRSKHHFLSHEISSSQHNQLKNLGSLILSKSHFCIFPKPVQNSQRTGHCLAKNNIQATLWTCCNHFPPSVKPHNTAVFKRAQPWQSLFKVFPSCCKLKYFTNHHVEDHSSSVSLQIHQTTTESRLFFHFGKNSISLFFEIDACFR